LNRNRVKWIASHSYYCSTGTTNQWFHRNQKSLSNFIVLNNNFLISSPIDLLLDLLVIVPWIFLFQWRIHVMQIKEMVTLIWIWNWIVYHGLIIPFFFLFYLDHNQIKTYRVTRIHSKSPRLVNLEKIVIVLFIGILLNWY